MKLLAAIHQENWGQKRTMALAEGGVKLRAKGGQWSSLSLI